MRTLLGLVLLLSVSVARADLPSPRLDRLTPPGGKAGSTVEIELAGADLAGVKTLRFDHPGLSAVPVKDRTFRVTIAADVPTGTYDVWAVGTYGISNPRLFAVQQGLAEVAEKEPNDDLATAHKVPLDCVISGTSDSNREDVFRFPARKGDRVVIECQAQKLDSALDATLTVQTSEGRPIGSNGDYFGRDPLVEFVAPADGEYVVSIADLSFRGGLPYRLTITTKPHVENLFPRAVRAGRPSAVQVFGRNLGSVAKPSTLLVNDLPLDQQYETVAPPEEILRLGQFRFTDHPTNHSVLPTAATYRLTGIQHWGVPLVVSPTDVTVEQEPNDDSSKPQVLTLPTVVSGRFDKERDADWYEFDTGMGGKFRFEVFCEAIGGRADPYLVLVNPKGERFAEFDDAGPRVNAFDGHLRDPVGSQDLPAKQKIRVMVQDRYRRGGPRYQYVLVIRPAEPDFRVAAIHHQNPGPGGTTLWRGGSQYLDLIVEAQDGFTGPITITAEGLPKGVHLDPTTISIDGRSAMVIRADADAPADIGAMRLLATGTINGKAVTREVRPYTRVLSEANQASSRPMRHLPVAVIAEPTPFTLQVNRPRIEIPAGGNSDLTVSIDRKAAGFTGAVTLQPLAFPGSMKLTANPIAEKKNEGPVTIEVPAGARPGEYTVALLGQAQVPLSRDGKPAVNTLVTLPSRTFIVVVPPSKK